MFYLYGGKIRAKSKLIQEMAEDKRRQEEKRERGRVRRESVEEADVEKSAVDRGEAEANAGFGMRTGAAVGEVEVEKRAAELRGEAEMREKERRG